MRKRKATIFIFVIIAILASIFRTTNLDLIEFKADEAINVFLASRFLFDHAIPPGGTGSSVGILNFPLTNYILIPFVLISADPRVISFFIGLINSLSVGFFFLIIKKYYRFKLAIFSSLLMAFSPWMILFSRKIWAQDFIIPLSIPLLFSIHKIVIEKDVRFWIVGISSSLLLIQLHQSLIFFLFPLFVFLFLQRVKFNFKYASLGFLIGITPALPYFFYQISNGCPDCSSLLFASERLSEVRYLSIFARPFQILSQGNFHHVIGNDMEAFSTQFSLAFELRKLFYIEYILLPIGMLIFWMSNKKFRFLVYATIVLPIIYYLLRVEPFTHYFIILAPILFLFLSYPFLYILELKNIFIKIITYSFFVLLITESILFNDAFTKYLMDRKSLSGDYGTVYIANQKVISSPLKKYQNDKHYKEMLIADFVPMELTYGYLPVGRMIYSHDQTKNNLPNLEKRLRDVDIDPRVIHELLAYYTYEIPTKKSLDFLKIKSKQDYARDLIYKHAYEIYLAKNFKKNLKTDVFILEYPEHWNVNIENGNIEIFGDGYKFDMKRYANSKSADNRFKILESFTVLNSKTFKYSCSNVGRKGCLFSVFPVKIGDDLYEITYNYAKTEKYDEKIIDTMDEILQSIRLLNY